MRRLICAFAVRIWHKTHFLMAWLNFSKYMLIIMTKTVFPLQDVWKHLDLYQSLNRVPIWNSQNCSVFPLAFVAGSLQRHWWGFFSRNYVVWPIFFLMNVFIALKGSHFLFLFAFTAAGGVQCGGRKTSPRTSTIVQLYFLFSPLRSARIFWEIRNKWLV